MPSVVHNNEGGVPSFLPGQAQGKGLWLMTGPGYDPASVPGLVAAGATAVVFTTGNGSTLGNAKRRFKARQLRQVLPTEFCSSPTHS